MVSRAGSQGLARVFKVAWHDREVLSVVRFRDCRTYNTVREKRGWSTFAFAVADGASWDEMDDFGEPRAGESSAEVYKRYRDGFDVEYINGEPWVRPFTPCIT